jgi:hypothetical protein
MCGIAGTLTFGKNAFKEAFSRYLSFIATPEPQTLVDGIKKLSPGTLLKHCIPVRTNDCDEKKKIDTVSYSGNRAEGMFAYTVTPAMNDLRRNQLRLFMNLFLPFMKLLQKQLPL